MNCHTMKILPPPPPPPPPPPTASILETKLLANSVISDHKKHNSKFCAIDLKDLFLNTPMEKPEYIRIHRKYFSQAFLSTYKLTEKIANDNHVYCRVKKGMLPTKFALCIDNFGIKYNSDQDLQHLIQILKKYYDISIDKEDKNCCGLTFDWNYKDGYVDIIMPGYVPKALQQFNHPPPI